MNTTTEFDPLFDRFLSHQDFGHGRRKHYMVLKRMIGRYVIYRRIILHDDSFRFDVRSVCPEILYFAVYQAVQRFRCFLHLPLELLGIAVIRA